MLTLRGCNKCEEWGGNNNKTISLAMQCWIKSAEIWLSLQREYIQNIENKPENWIVLLRYPPGLYIAIYKWAKYTMSKTATICRRDKYTMSKTVMICRRDKYTMSKTVTVYRRVDMQCLRLWRSMSEINMQHLRLWRSMSEVNMQCMRLWPSECAHEALVWNL